MMIHCQRFTLESKLHSANSFTIPMAARVALRASLAGNGKVDDPKIMGLELQLRGCSAKRTVTRSPFTVTFLAQCKKGRVGADLELANCLRTLRW
jgi:hypothetical protein